MAGQIYQDKNLNGNSILDADKVTVQNDAATSNELVRKSLLCSVSPANSDLRRNGVASFMICSASAEESTDRTIKGAPKSKPGKLCSVINCCAGQSSVNSQKAPGFETIAVIVSNKQASTRALCMQIMCNVNFVCPACAGSRRLLQLRVQRPTLDLGSAVAY